MTCYKKRFGILLIVFVLVFNLVGCSGTSNNDSESQNIEENERRIAYFSYSTEPFIDLDPSVEYSNGIITLHNIYETLTRYNHNTKKVDPLLATSWSNSDDGKEWIFKIRENVKFHDGTDLNAESVKKSIERTIDMQMGAAYIWSSVESIEVISDYEVKFVLSYPAPIDLISSAGYAAFIMSPKAVEKESSWFNEGNAAGTGPYRLSKITKGEEVIMQQFENYWQGWQENQYTDVIIKKTAESTSRRQLIQKGEASITSDLSVTDVKALSEDENVEVIIAPSWKNVIGFFNTEKPPLDNTNFRKALNYAFPYDEVISNVKEDLATPSYGLIPEGLWGHNEDLPQYEFNLEKAQEYIDKSGVDPSEVELEMTFTTGNEAFRNSAQLYKVYLKKLGIELSIREMRWDSVWQKSKLSDPLERQDILVMYWWPDYPSPISWLQSLLHSEEEIFFNLSYLKDDEIDNMIDEGASLTATDRKKAEEIFVAVQEKAIEKAYTINMYDDKSVWVTNTNFKGFEPNPAYAGVVFFYDTYYEE